MADQKTPQPEEFQDPLENYDPEIYTDPLERALAEQQVSAIQHQPYASVSPETTVAEAVARLSEMQVACLLVEEEGKLVGVFSDRDALDKVSLEFNDIKDHPVRDAMTSDPIYVYEHDSAAAALSVMAVSGYRHVPVVDIDLNLVGIVSPQRVTAFLQQYLAEPAE